MRKKIAHLFPIFSSRRTQANSRKSDVGALELIEIMLYVYALSRFVSEFGSSSYNILENNESSSQTILIAVSSLMFMVLFSIVIVRSYLSIRILDGGTSDGLGYLFVLKNSGLYRIVEKSLRLFSVLIVIIAPKLSEKILFGIGNNIVNLSQEILSFISKEAILRFNNLIYNLPIKYAPDTEYHIEGDSVFHQNLEYYSAVLFLLASVYILYDVVNAIGVKKRIPPSGLSYDGANPKSSDNDEVLSYMAFINVRHSEKDVENSDNHIQKYPRTLGLSSTERAKKFRKIVEQEKILTLYFRYSPKFRERMFLLIFSVSSMISSYVEGHTISFLLMAFSFYFYYKNAQKDVKFVDAWREVANNLRNYF